MDIEVFKYFGMVPHGAKNITVPKAQSIIYIIDGSGSMSGYYEVARQDYQTVYGAMPNAQGFQFSSSVGPLDPFMCGGTDIQCAFVHLIGIINNGGLNHSLTVVFVSDGQGSEAIQTLKPQFDQIRTKHQIQFISIAVGSGFPTKLSNGLRTLIHNGTNNIPAILPVNKPDQFLAHFQTIKNQFLIQYEDITINEQILRQPWNITNKVKPGEVVASKDEYLTFNGEKYVTTFTTEQTQLYINSSVQLILQLASANDPQIMTYIDSAIKYITFIRKTLEQSGAIHKIQLYTEIGKSLQLLIDLRKGRMNIQSLTDVQLKEIMISNSPGVQVQVANQSLYAKNLLSKAPAAQQAAIRKLIMDYHRELLNADKDDRFDILISKSTDAQVTAYLQANQEWTRQLIDSEMILKWQ